MNALVALFDFLVGVAVLMVLLKIGTYMILSAKDKYYEDQKNRKGRNDH